MATGREAAMVAGGDHASPGGDADEAVDDVPRRQRAPQSRWVPASVIAAAATCGLAALVMWSSSPPPAEVVGPPGRVPEAPASAVAQRWAVGLVAGDDVAMVADRLVVVLGAPRGQSPDIAVTARDVRTGTTAWERQLARGSVALVVEDGGATTVMDGGGSSVGGVHPRRLVALDAGDARVLWEREVSFVIGASAGHVLLATDVGCELVEARSGRTTWREGTQRCLWLDDDEVMVSRRGRWEVVGTDGAATRRPVPGTDPPAAVGEDLVARDGDRLVLLDRSGRARWRTGRALPTADGPVRVTGLAGVGVVATGWDEDAGRPLVEAYGLDGRPLEDPGSLVDAAVVWTDGRTLLVAPTPDDTLEVRSMDAPHRTLVAVPTWATTVTTRGLLAPPSTGDRLELLTWPDLDVSWSADMSSVVATHGRWDEVLASASGMVVLATEPRMLYAYG